MTKIYLIRHAEAEGNLYRIAQGQYDSLVTDRGQLQIQALRRRFEDVQVDAVYSSDLYRTCVTAGAVYIPKGLPLHRRADLREICVGEWEQKTWGQIAQEDGEQMDHFSHRLDLWHVPGAETPEQVRDRVLSAVREIAAENEGRTVAVFSHGCAIRILLATVQGYSIAQIGQTPLGSNTAVSLLEIDGGSIRVVFRDDVSHLPETLVRKRAGQRPLDPGLIFAPARLPEQADWLCRAAAEAWEDCAVPTPDRKTLLGQAAERPTLIGSLDGAPVGLLQLDEDREAARGRGWLALYGVCRAYRAAGYGVQLLGQAVQHYRPLGRETLCLALPESADAWGFFQRYGFQPTGERTAQGWPVLEKDIGFKPLPGVG